MELWLFLLLSCFFLTAGTFLFAPRHLVFVVFLFMNWVVFFLVPFSRHALDASTYQYGLAWPWIMLFCAFYVPLFLLYLFFGARRRSRAPDTEVPVRRVGTLGYALAMALFALAYVAVVARSGLFYLRIGHAALAEALMSMGLLEHAVLRLFTELLPLLLPANMLLFRIIRLQPVEKLLLGVYVCVGWLSILVNSRFDALVVILVYFILLMAVRPSGRRLLGGVLRFGALVVVLMLLVSYGRTAYFANKGEPGTGVESIFVRSQWLDRADGMSMIGDIHHGAAGRGFMWGAAWENALMLNYYYLFDQPRYREIKLGLKTNPKVLIAEKYRGVEVSDTPSSYLDDLYANFSVLGLLLGALVLAVVLSRASRVITARRLGSIAFFIGVWAVIRALYVDNEFLSMVIVFFKFLPLVVVFAALYPAGTAPRPRALPAAGNSV